MITLIVMMYQHFILLSHQVLELQYCGDLLTIELFLCKRVRKQEFFKNLKIESPAAPRDISVLLSHQVLELQHQEDLLTIMSL